MNQPRSLTRRLAIRLAAHAHRVLPEHRSEWASAISNELDHLPERASLRWAIGAVFASYVERARAFRPNTVIDMMRSFLVSCALVFGGLLLIEGSHVLTQFLLQDDALRLLQQNLPTSLLTTDAGFFVPLAMLLTIVISVPVAIVACVLANRLIRWAPSRAGTIIRATIVADAIFVAGAIVVNVLLMPGAPFHPSTILLWLIRVLFVAMPLLILLRMNRARLDATTG